MENKTITIQKLNGQNFYLWKFKVELLLQRDKLWSVVSQDPPVTPNEDWITRDQAAKATMCLAIEDNLLINVRTCTTSKDTWKTLARIYEHPSMSSKLYLMRKLYGTRYTHYHNMREYINAIMEIVGQLHNMGEVTNEKNIIAVILCGLPPDYNNLITAIESKDESNISLDYVKIKLFEEAERRENPNEEHNIDSTALPAFKTMEKPRTFTCYGCGQTGHTRRQCPKDYQPNFNKWRQPQNLRQYGRWNENNEPQPNTVMSSMIRDTEGISDYDDNYSEQHSTCAECHCKSTKEHTALSGTMDNPPNQWILDSGASAHMSSDKNFFDQITYMKESIPITLANGNIVHAKGQGNGFIHIDNDIRTNDPVILRDVLFVPDLKFQLISIKQLCQRGHRVTFENDHCIIANNNKTIARAYIQKGTFVLKVNDSHQATPCIHSWHNRTGHRSHQSIKNLNSHHLAQGLKINTCQHSDFCKSCQIGKMKQRPFTKSNEVVPRPFHTIVTDVCGPMPERSLGGNQYVLTITDKFSRYVHVDMMKNKSQTAENIRNYMEKGNNVFGYYPVILRSDGGGEFDNQILKEYLSSRGITHQIVVPYSPQQNGNAERINSTLLSMGRCMLKHNQLPNHLWGEAINTAAYLTNRSIHSATQKTPYKLWYGSKPNLSHLKTFGCQAFGCVPRIIRRKLDDTATEGVFVGYGKDVKGFRIWVPNSNKVITSAKIVCNEDIGYMNHQLRDPYNPIPGYIPINLLDDSINFQQDENIGTQLLRRSPRENKGVPPDKLTLCAKGML